MTTKEIQKIYESVIYGPNDFQSSTFQGMHKECDH